MGYGSYVGEECTIKAKVGRFCSIGHKVTVLTGTHPSHKYVSTNPAFFSLGLQNGTTFVKEQKLKRRYLQMMNISMVPLLGMMFGLDTMRR
jgi:hypothetical protein